METGKQTQKAVNLVRTLIENYAEKRTSPELDLAIEKHSEIEQFLQQEEDEVCSMADTLNKLSELTGIDIPKEEYDESLGEDIIK